VVTSEARGCVGALNGCMKRSFIEPKYSKASVDPREALAQTYLSVVEIVQEVYITITQLTGLPPLPKLEVLPNFRVGQ